VHTKRNFALLIRVLLAVASLAAFPAANANVFGVVLGAGAPPFTVGPYRMQAFDQGPQAAIPDLTSVPSTPTPIGGVLGFIPDAIKATVGVNWTSWSDGYTGPVFAFVGDNSGTSSSLTLPAHTTAFSFFYEGGGHASSNVTVTSNSGTVVGPINVVAADDATGIGFYTTDPTDFITSVSIVSDDVNFAVAEFSIADPSDLITPAASVPVPTLSQWSFLLLAALMALGGVMPLRRRHRNTG
jgi:hypothetical protein